MISFIKNGCKVRIHIIEKIVRIGLHNILFVDLSDGKVNNFFSAIQTILHLQGDGRAHGFYRRRHESGY